PPRPHGRACASCPLFGHLVGVCPRGCRKLPRATHRERVVGPRRYGPEVGASIAGNDRSRGRVDRSAAHGGPLPGPYLRARPHGRRATLLAAALGVSLFWSSS